ncbi:DUF2804 domain-containing protein [Xylanimonas oleitrophica]|uniref:DUF2804 domain-containing protein n=1 Tax=Xylanimonas oleitrophica TaxID=2607479 RepID=A0A2W5YFL4_9MICO|nr:DUF2804 domain-containing protein [Xylanimonas oleitrophica]PZR53351.1 DUF2804 domain-containing protein [Xylanimonas oleitrophica]
MNLDDVVDGQGALRFGRFPRRPATVDPLRRRSLVPSGLRRMRLKQWVGWTLVHPDWAGSMILQDAGYLASAELYVAERATGVRHEYQAGARRGTLRLPTDLFQARVPFRRGGFGLEYRFDRAGGAHKIVIDVAAHDDAPAVRGELTLDARAAAPDLAVSSRLPGGTLYTTKATYPVSGTLRVGDRDVVFDPARDAAILDEHRSALTYRTGWTWGTFAFHDTDDDGALCGANFAVRPGLPGQEEESGLWSPQACEPLSDVVFTPGGRRWTDAPGALAARDDLDHPWTVRSRDGRLDVVFTPDGLKTVGLSYGVVAMDYVQIFGRYSGTLTAGGRERKVDGAPGVLEEMKARW